MSGIVGCFNLDGAPAEGELIGRMLGQISYRGPDGVGSWVRGPVALAHAMLRTTSESSRERQPCFDEAAGLCVVMHGRVDNRAQLLAELGIRGAAAKDLTDVELVLRAYERWRKNCPAWIVGDFAFVIWDERNRELFCARDPLGSKPFYYACPGNSVLFASEPRALLEDFRVSTEPNEGVVAEYLSGGPRDLEETLLKAVRRLPPAHALSVTAGGIRIERYWDFDLAREVRHRSDDEYAGHFMEVFRETVACSMRSPGAVGILLSGGLDSTSIVCVERMLRRDGVLPAGGLESFSMSFPGTLCDETPYIEDVVRATGVASTVIPWARENPFYFAERARRSLDFPGYPNGDFVYGPIEALASAKGIRVMLTGMGGDEGFTGSVSHYADMLREFRFVSLIRQLLADREYERGDRRLVPVIFGNQTLLREGILPLIPPRVRRAISRAIGRRFHPQEWLRDDFCRRVGLEERVRPRPDNRESASFAQRHLVRLFSGASSIHETEVLERMTAGHGVELRSPFLDRRMLQFALALPEDQRWRGKDTKFVLRQAMRRLLPESVRARRTKADFSHMVVESLVELSRQGFWDSLELTRRGWVDDTLLRQAVRNLEVLYRRGDDEYTQSFWPLWMAAGIEFWLRGLAAHDRGTARNRLAPS